MFEGNKSVDDYSETERAKAKMRYLDAISASVQGNAVVVLKRNVSDLFERTLKKMASHINGIEKIFTLSKANSGPISASVNC